MTFTTAEGETHTFRGVVEYSLPEASTWTAAIELPEPSVEGDEFGGEPPLTFTDSFIIECHQSRYGDAIELSYYDPKATPGFVDAWFVEEIDSFDGKAR